VKSSIFALFAPKSHFLKRNFRRISGLHPVCPMNPANPLREKTMTDPKETPGARPRNTRTQIMRFDKKVEYCINSAHVLSFLVTADVVPVSVNLSSEVRRFCRLCHRFCRFYRL
jgi:hypothetical protein